MLIHETQEPDGMKWVHYASDALKLQVESSEVPVQIIFQLLRELVCFSVFRLLMGWR